jgi:hypothetical protein
MDNPRRPPRVKGSNGGGFTRALLAASRVSSVMPVYTLRTNRQAGPMENLYSSCRASYALAADICGKDHQTLDILPHRIQAALSQNSGTFRISHPA